MERTDRWHLCECGPPFPRGLRMLARLLVCPVLPSRPRAAYKSSVASPGQFYLLLPRTRLIALHTGSGNRGIVKIVVCLYACVYEKKSSAYFNVLGHPE